MIKLDITPEKQRILADRVRVLFEQAMRNSDNQLANIFAEAERSYHQKSLGYQGSK